MTKIKGKVSDVISMLQTIKLEGKDPDGSNSSMINNCLLEAKGELISTNVLSKTNVVIGFITYKKLSVVEEGEIPVGNIDEFISYLNRFEGGDEVSIETTENKIKILRDSPKKIANIPMTDRDNVDDSLRALAVKDSVTEENGLYKFRETELPAMIKVDSRHIKQILDDGNVQGLNRRYPIVIDDEVECRVGDEQGGMIENTITVLEKKGKAKSSFSSGIDNVFSNITGEVEVYMADGGPMLVMQNNEEFELKFVIAPLMEEE